MKGLEEALLENKIFIGKTEGDSMYPMLVEGRDTVIITPPKFPLKKLDVPVYRRDSHYTMHRIVKVTKKGYIICGDNRSHLERDIKDEDIVGVLFAFYREGQYIECTDSEYLKYSKRICRGVYFRLLKRLVKKIFRKVDKI